MNKKKIHNKITQFEEKIFLYINQVLIKKKTIYFHKFSFQNIKYILIIEIIINSLVFFINIYSITYIKK
jgi:hypothetical protein